MPSITSEEINGMLRSSLAILGRLKNRLVPIASENKRLTGLQAQLGVVSGESFVADDVWQKKAETAQSEAYVDLRAFVRHLRRLHLAELAPGALVFLGLAALLCLLAVGYHSQHSVPSSAEASQIADAQIFEVLRAKEALGAALGVVASKSAERAATTDPKAQKAIGAEIEAAFVHLQGTAAALQTALFRNDLSRHLGSSTLALLAQASAQIDARQASAKDTFDSLRKTLEPEVESLRGRYLWTEVPWRWFEIAWWAEFGTLVGLLFYVAGCLELGTFRTEQLSMFVTEIVITPLVVTVVFFLLSYIGISGFSPEASIAQTVGFAFILGFAIRRTVGLLDLLKKRFLPDPAPAKQETC